MSFIPRGSGIAIMRLCCLLVLVAVLGCVAPFVREKPPLSHGNVPVVEVRIPGREEPLRMVLDTGSPTVLAASVAREVDGLFEVDRTRTVGDDFEGRDLHGGTVRVSPRILSSMEVGGIPVQNAIVFVSADMDEIRRFCPRIDGLLGVGAGYGLIGALNQLEVHVSPDRVRFRERELGLDRPEGTVATRRSITGDSKTKAGGVFVRVGVGGREVDATLDLGSQDLSYISVDLFEEIRTEFESLDLRRFEGAYGVGLGRRLSPKVSWITRIPSVSIGGVEFHNLPFRVVPRGRAQLPIVLSNDLVAASTMILDLGNDRVIFEDAPDDLAPVRVPTMIAWHWDAGTLLVDGLLQSGEAARAGIEPGDRIVGWNGVAVDWDPLVNDCASKPSLRRGPGEFVELEIQRDGQTFLVEISRWERTLDP